MRLGGGVHLGYCSNIHPGESWPETLRNLREHLPAVRAALGRAGPFGLGLRLSAAAAQALAEPAALDELRTLMRDAGLYLFTVNGFPYGAFHGTRVKHSVYEPDWRDPRRLAYTTQLAELMAALMPPPAPDDPEAFGSLSTVPGGFKPALAPEDDAPIADALIRQVAELVRIERRSGARVMLALEPEPCCRLETVDEALDFFDRWLFSVEACRRLGTLTGLATPHAERALRRHLGLCLDLCHAAVEFEDPATLFDRLDAAGIEIAKLQISAGLRLPQLDAGSLQALRRFDDPVYLHQVVQRDAGGELRRFVDLGDAMASLADANRAPGLQWRVHFHVPVFLAALPQFDTTQDFLRAALARQRQRPLSRHLEVETYTWDVLPQTLRDRPVDEAIAAELRWVLDELQA